MLAGTGRKGEERVRSKTTYTIADIHRSTESELHIYMCIGSV